MNRAQRRGNYCLGRPVAPGGRFSNQATAGHQGPAPKVNLREAYLVASGQKKPREVKEAKEANQRPRSTSGRFQKSSEASAASPAPLLPQVSLTRQQRRHQERIAAKVARAWSKATDGAGVTLIDGQEVSGES